MSAVEKHDVDGPVGPLVAFSSGSRDESALPVVLVHGINMASDVWTEVAALVAQTRQAITIDLRGHGQSCRSGPYTADGYADDVIAVLDSLGVDRAHVAGTSFGGSTACALAFKAPERVASIITFGSATSAPGLDVDGAVAAIRAAGPRAFFSAFMPQASFAPGVDPALIERALDAATNNRDVETIVDVSVTALSADGTNDAQAVTVPALVVTGELDMTCPPTSGQALAEALRAEFMLIPDRGHVISMEDPALVAGLIEQHAAKHDAT